MFFDSYVQTLEWVQIEDSIWTGVGILELDDFFSNLWGYSFRKWQFRTFTLQKAREWNGLVWEIFGLYKWRIMCFWYDWMGRIFAIDILEKNRLVMLEVSVWEAQIADISLMDFLIDTKSNPDGYFFDKTFFWVMEGIHMLDYKSCFGYKKPLFLWGKDEPENMEIVDMKFYWEFTWQLWNSVKDMSSGTKIGNIQIDN